LLRIFILRAVLIALPFVAWFVWKAWAERTGRPMGATPWTWLTAAGLVLVGLSLLVTPLFHRDNRGEVYVPGELTSDGRVSEGRYEQQVPEPR
jgi:DMSO/TMAO reductase YedYZ heme-binding membrane subunit